MVRRGRLGGRVGRSVSRGRSRSRSQSPSRGRRSPSRGRPAFRRQSPSRFGRRGRPRRNITRQFRRPVRRGGARPHYYYRGYRRRPYYYYSVYPQAYYTSVAYVPPYYTYDSPYYAYEYADASDYALPADVNPVRVGSARNVDAWLAQPNTAIHQSNPLADPVFLYCDRGRPVLAAPGSGTVQRPLLPIDNVYYQCSCV